MANALFAFENPEAGRRAVDHLLAAGLRPDAVHLHVHDVPPLESKPRLVDEQVTGGLLTNLADLFQGLFDWGDSPHDAASFEETYRRGGAVVSVDAASDQEEATTEQVMRQEPCDRHTDWSRPSGVTPH
jgi:hypothetical protein